MIIVSKKTVGRILNFLLFAVVILSWVYVIIGGRYASNIYMKVNYPVQ